MYPHSESTRLSLAWLLLGLTALFISNLFAVGLILLRTTNLPYLLKDPTFFHTLLALHVNLSVVVWFLAFAGTLWSFSGGERWQRVEQTALYLGVLGTFLILISPWIGPGHAIMSNYLPILRNPIFLTGLFLFGCGTSLSTLRACFTLRPFQSKHSSPNRLGLFVAALAFLFSLIAFIHAAWTLLPERMATDFYENLFWGGGHMLQFLHTLLMFTIWLWLAQLSGLKISWNHRWIGFWFVIGVMPALLSPLFFLGLNPESQTYRLFFTQLMSYGSWLASPALGIALAWQWLRQKKHNTDKNLEQRFFQTALLFSLFLFTLGIIIGSLINNDSVMVTAHYHGTVGAITLAYMGITFHLLKLFGFTKPINLLNSIQIYIYGSGLTLLVAGLAWSGFHGAPRKTPLALHGSITLDEIIRLATIGTGGLIGLVGGFLFLFLVFKTIRSQRRTTS